jgi:hypothetical protein
MQYSVYYQAHVEREQCWFVVAALKTYDHVCFDRTIDVETSLFEFFVPVDMEETFLVIMRYFEHQKLLTNLRKLPHQTTPQ